ncbi:MAG: 50S ribosomal protein L4 [Candidatus Methanoperedens sp.]|nr:50S ribosomal protein L4 [Candidatus Methanoperedens sp.]
MKVPVFDLDGKEVEKIDLPAIFSADYRPDLIRRAFYALRSHSIQPQGRDPMAGMRTSAMSWNTGRGVARMARVKGERHPRVKQKINRHERRLALISAIAATARKDVVASRGHKIEDIQALPIVVSDDIQSISRTRDLKALFVKLNLEKEVKRISNGVRSLSGISRLRGRARRQAVGPLIIGASDTGIGKASDAFPGVKFVPARNLSTLDLAPGAHPGRLVLWSKSSLTALPEVLYQKVNVNAT